MKKVSAICLVVAALLLLVFFISLFLSIRPDPDDMIISLDIREHSLYYALKMRYLFSSFRTTLIISDAFVLGSNNVSSNTVSLFIYYLFIFSLLIFVLYSFLQRSLASRPVTWQAKSFLLCMAVVLAGALYFFCSSRIEVFGWLGASEGHLVPMVFVLLSLLVLFKKTSSMIHLLILGICVLVISGGAEHINAIVILLNLFLLYLVYRRKTLGVNKRKLLFFSVFHFICFAAVVSNPGVWHRLHDVNLAQAGMHDPGNFFVMFFQPYKFTGIVLACFAASMLSKSFTVSVPPVPFKVLVAIGAFLFLICFSMSFASYHTFALGRIWFPFDIFLFFCFALLGMKMNSSPPAYASASIFVVVLVAIHCYRHIPALNHFKKEYDKIVTQVAVALPGQVISIKKFPEPDLVNLVELSADPDDQLNQLFCRFYGSKGKIAVRSDYSKSR